MSKKMIYTLATKAYQGEITRMTFPLIKMWAQKIGADLYVIEDRKWPNAPMGYEKFQIYELAQKHGAEWNIYIDSDALVHPDFFDITACLNKDTTCSYGTDFSLLRFNPDKYFWRDGRFIAKGNWFLVASDWCLDIWHPLDDITIEEAISNCHASKDEMESVVDNPHLIDDYVVSRNISRYGLKHILTPEIYAHYKICDQFKLSTGQLGHGHLVHQYTLDYDKKVVWMCQELNMWGIRDSITCQKCGAVVDAPFSPNPQTICLPCATKENVEPGSRKPISVSYANELPVPKP